MVTTEPPIVSRLKREDCKRTKHDSEFTKWKILVGPSDWEDHSSRKEGAERYRVHNLPLCCHCPGVYELGISVSPTGLGREVGKLDPAHIVVVYLGQAEDIRARLQHYGRSGAHLAKVDSTGNPNNCKNMPLQRGSGLFEGIFSRGYSIVFRWAPIESKRDAERTESRLLKTFDYAWNKGSNGARRPSDVLRKLEKTSSSTPPFPSITRKFQMLGQKQVGIIIKASKPFLQENGLSTDQDINSLLARVFKFGRSQPRLVSDRVGVTGNYNSTCGVALGDGTICERPPVEGRKRCAEHKGMKTKSSFSKPIVERKPQMVDLNRESEGHSAQSYGYTVNFQLVGSKCPVNKDFTIICGVILDDGFPCKRQPVLGRKRCEEHKGMRTNVSISNSTVGKSHHTYESKLQPQVLPDCRSFSNTDYGITCGVDLGHGIFCKRLAVAGRKRCEEHKGMRINSFISTLAGEDKSHALDMGSGFITYNNSNYNHTSTCGMTLGDGSLCKRQPVEGNKRCWQHKGMRVNCSSSWFGSETTLCGVLLRNGSVCSRVPAHGRKRCEQHKGMRL